MLSGKAAITLEILIQLNSLIMSHLHLVALSKCNCFSWIKLCQRLSSYTANIQPSNGMRGLWLVSLQQPLLLHGSCCLPAHEEGDCVETKSLFPQCSMCSWLGAVGIVLPTCPCPGQHPALPANQLYQHQLTPPASQGVPVLTVHLGRGCCPHAPAPSWGHPERSWALPLWWPWSPSLPLGTGSGLVLVAAAWHPPCPPVPALSLAVLPLLSLFFPLPAACVGRGPTALPLPGICFPATRAYSSGGEYNELLGWLCSFTGSRDAGAG